ncbi:MAG TPA: DnaD domain protein, partial [Bacilli bacterium]|nr:DnaD domain protein [Bacilli bacterium]
KGLVNDKTFNKKTRELINNLTYIYDLDDLQVIELLRTVITENSTIDKEALRKSARRLYQYHHDGTLPTLIYRKQPEYLKTPLGNTSNKAKIIYVFENTSPYDFLKSKNKGVKPTNHDLKIIESLILDLNLKPAVVNVLIDYVLKKNNNKLNQAFIETIAGQWKRQGIETAGEAMAIAVLESKKYTKKIMPQQSNAKDPVWFNTQIEKDAISSEESAELAELLKEFR